MAYPQNIRKLVALLFVCCTVLAAPVLAENVPSDEVQLVSGEFPPFSGEALPGGGIATRIVTTALAEMQQSAKVVFHPWKRGFAETQSGNFYATFPYSFNEDRDQTWYFSDALYALDEVFFTAATANFDYTSHADLQGRSVCKPIGYNLFELKKLVESNVVRLERPHSMPACFRMLQAGRVDMVLTNEVTGHEIIKDLAIDPQAFKVLSTPFKKIGHHLIVPKTHPGAAAFIERFNAQVRKMTLSGAITPLLSPST